MSKDDIVLGDFINVDGLHITITQLVCRNKEGKIQKDFWDEDFQKWFTMSIPVKNLKNVELVNKTYPIGCTLYYMPNQQPVQLMSAPPRTCLFNDWNCIKMNPIKGIDYVTSFIII